jgi:CheY-like chemotaxis protein
MEVPLAQCRPGAFRAASWADAGDGTGWARTGRMEAPGLRAKASTCLPRVAGAVGDDRPPAEARIVRGKETLLLVEDQPSVRAITERIPRRRGCTVMAAGRAEEAEAAERAFPAHSQRVWVLLTDAVLPLVSGRKLYDLLKSQQQGPRSEASRCVRLHRRRHCAPRGARCQRRPDAEGVRSWAVTREARQDLDG